MPTSSSIDLEARERRGIPTLRWLQPCPRLLHRDQQGPERPVPTHYSPQTDRRRALHHRGTQGVRGQRCCRRGTRSIARKLLYEALLDELNTDLNCSSAAPPPERTRTLAGLAERASELRTGRSRTRFPTSPACTSNAAASSGGSGARRTVRAQRPGSSTATMEAGAACW